MLTPIPESPEAAKKTTPGWVKYLSHFVSFLTSGSPQLMLTTPPPFSATSFAPSVTASQNGSVAHPPELQSTDSTRKSLACGAMEWAHSMSKDSSTSQSP